MAGQFQVIDNDSKTGIKVTAPTIDEFFTVCAHGLKLVALGGGSFGQGVAEVKDLDIKAQTPEELLGKFLNETVAWLKNGRFVHDRMTLKVADDMLSLTAKASGLTYPALPLQLEVKTTLWQNLKIKKAFGRYAATVNFEV
ncbi:MAG: archease [Elusimicrobiota bacterium]